MPLPQLEIFLLVSEVSVFALVFFPEPPALPKLGHPSRHGYICKEDDVLELCSGTGLHTYALAQTGARVVASDISSHSLEVLSQRIGDRTKSTLLRMPTMERIQSISRGFKSAEVRYFGAVSFLMPILARIIGQSYTAEVSDAVDRLVHVRRTAFKFVLVARGRL